MLTDLKTLLTAASQGGYAVMAPDFVNLAMARGCLLAAEAAGAPLALSYSPAFLPVAEVGGYRRLLELVREAAQEASVPVAVHLDHGGFDEALAAIEVGFTSVMFDGSALPDEENLHLTSQVVEAARRHGVSVEAELGHVGSGTTYGDAESSPDAARLTEPKDAVRFARETGVDALAVAVGTAHGLYRGTPRLDFARLEELARRVPVPLVLHGCSGTGPKNLSRAVRLGIRKMNVFTDLVGPIKDAVERSAANSGQGLPDILAAANQALRSALDPYFDISRSRGRAR